MITGAVALDHRGVVRAGVGIRGGRIVALGKAGNPDIIDGVHPDLVIGPSTEILAGNGRILTAGAVDCHVHLICPQLLDEALGAGTATVIGGGTGPSCWTRRSARGPPRSSAAAPARPRAPRRPRSLLAPGIWPGCWRPPAAVHGGLAVLPLAGPGSAATATAADAVILARRLDLGEECAGY